MAQRLQGKVALITGASRGIGRAIAEAYAAQGAWLFLNARGPETLETTAGEIGAAHGTEVAWLAGDASDRASVDAVVARALETYGQIDILVNNAGIYRPAPFLEYRIEDFAAVVGVNLYSVFHMTQAVLPHMIGRKSGRVINIASTAGKWGSRNQSAYNASKHAIVGLTRCLALEMAGHGVRVNAICPWIVDTDLVQVFMTEHARFNGVPEETIASMMQNSVPLKRWIKPEEVAGLAVYLASDEAEYINGQAWTIDGGYTMI